MSEHMKITQDRKGHSGLMHEGLTTKNPATHDESRRPIGSKMPSVDEGAVRHEVGEAKPETLGPRTA